MTAAERAARTVAADQLCRQAYGASLLPDTGVALVATGGFGRGELAPSSDLDVVLVHDQRTDPGEAAAGVWYPLWDAGCRLDHSVRSLAETVAAADDDIRVALGLLDLRHLAGDPNLTLRLRSAVLAGWRRRARVRLPELRALVDRRHHLLGELAHVSVPDVKEAEGGLRDATVLRALQATWLVDAAGPEVERSRGRLLDVRDALHEETGRARDRIPPETWAPLAARLGLADADAAQRHVRGIGHRLTHLSRLAWRRTDAVLARPASVRTARRSALEPIARGVALSRGEVVLDRGARPRSDPGLLLRVAAAAAERDAVLAPATVARLLQDGQDLPSPWPVEARGSLVRLLASGRALLPVWETLEETDALAHFLPEWEQVRLLPHASVIHRFTVDRHAVETCIEASALIRTVARPDVLLLAALLHDIGKGGLVEHCVGGEPVARDIAGRVGLEEGAADTVALLVRRHLLLMETATSLDPDDPATVEALLEHVPDAETLLLLRALTEADARATAPKAWSAWRAGLVDRLTARALAVVGGSDLSRAEPSGEVELPDAVRRDPGAVWVGVAPDAAGARVTVVGPDRVGLLAEAAATLALQRVAVRAVRAWSQGDHGVSVWEVADPELDERVLRERLVAIHAGRVDATARAADGDGDRLGPAVAVRGDASRRATVLEVRTDDGPGVIHRVCAALARLDVSVCSAHASAIGPQAVVVFYLQEVAAGRLTDERAAAAAHAVRSALVRPSSRRG